MIKTIHVIVFGLISGLPSCSSQRDVFVTNGIHKVLARPGILGSKGYEIKSHRIKAENRIFRWETQFGNFSLTGKNNPYPIHLCFLKSNGGRDWHYIKMGDGREGNPKIKVYYRLYNKAGENIMILSTRLDNWTASESPYWANRDKRITGTKIEYWFSDISNSRLKEERNRENVYFYPEKEKSYTLEVTIDCSAYKGSLDGVVAEILMRTGGTH